MELKVYGAQVPLVVFGMIALLAALLVTFMPETSKTPLPDTIQVTRNTDFVSKSKCNNVGW